MGCREISFGVDLSDILCDNKYPYSGGNLVSQQTQQMIVFYHKPLKFSIQKMFQAKMRLRSALM